MLKFHWKIWQFSPPAIVLFIILAVKFLRTQCNASEITYSEPTSDFIMLSDSASYADGTILLHLRGGENMTETFNDKIISIRLVFPNGTITALDVNTTLIPNYNDTFTTTYALSENNIFITYITDTETRIGNKSAIISDWSGNIVYGPIILTESNVYKEGLVLNTNPTKGFLWAQGFEKNVKWFQFTSPDEKGHINQINNDSISLGANMNLNVFHLFPTVDENYGVALTARNTRKVTYSEDNSTIPLQPEWYTFVSLVYPEVEHTSQPLLIYQTSTNLKSLEICDCGSHYDSSGYTCILLGQENKGNTTLSAFMKVSFYSSGSINTIEQFNIEGDGNKTINQSWIYKIRPMYYGGYVTINLNLTNKSILGLIYNRNGTFRQYWSLPDNMPLDEFVSQGVLPNNTLWLAYHHLISSETWTLISTPLPRLMVDDLGFENPNIVNVEPSGKKIDIMATDRINITYQYPLALSTANISIYQYRDGANDLLRQTFSSRSDLCTLINNTFTISCQVFPTTFNRWNTSYYVLVDNNFVKTSGVNEPLYGIKRHRWNITTKAETSDNTYADSTMALVRLTPEGTRQFNALPSPGKTEFVKQLQYQLAETIPIESSRLKATNRHQADGKSNNQRLLQFQVRSTKDLDELNVKDIIFAANGLIMNKKMTALANYNLTNLLDEQFGFQQIPNLWYEIRYKLAIASGFLFLLFISYLIARRKNKEANNIVIFRFALAIVDLVFDTLFIIENSRDVPWLYTPRKWNKVASAFTILASSNVEVLKILSSQLFGFDMFSAPFTAKTEVWIFWGSTVNILIEDVPQLLIQILYLRSTVSYSIIPLSTLIVTSVVLLNNIISKTFDFVIKNQKMMVMANGILIDGEDEDEDEDEDDSNEF
ncbi:hypothetical protein G9A89_009424 [Geosiphon pyriformis]|nr:hypothetical protein G9A89_009424 [Geosiphon pyriformis]